MHLTLTEAITKLAACSWVKAIGRTGLLFPGLLRALGVCPTLTRILCPKDPNLCLKHSHLPSC